jgi:hypothetical protein
MDAREYLNRLLEEGKIVRLTHRDGAQRVGQGHAIILNRTLQMAVMIEDCGSSAATAIRAGDVVSFLPQAEGESTIVGRPARIA